MDSKEKSGKNIYPDASRGVLANRSSQPLDPPSRITRQTVVQDHYFLLFFIGLMIPFISVIVVFLLTTLMFASFFSGGAVWAGIGLALIFGPLTFAGIWFLLSMTISFLEVESSGKIAYAVTAFYGGLLLIAHGVSKAMDGSLGTLDKPLGYNPFNLLFLGAFVLGSISLPFFVALNEHRFRSFRLSAATLCVISSVLMLVGLVLLKTF